MLLIDAPPTALVTGFDDLAGAALSLGATALAAFAMARARHGDDKPRERLFAGAAAALLYIVSVAIVTIFQPGAETTPEPFLDLTVRQEGQVLLSTLWGAAGLAALIVGLRRRHAAVRSVALCWLMITVVKVFLYDLSTLSSIYRVVSFFALGLLLLAGAYAYQRLRPPSLPDMRAMHPSQL